LGPDGQRIISHPAGAPPLDWWEIPTQPYKGSHYAAWPEALLTRPIAAMCPQRVCTKCGEPSRRIVEAERVDAEGNVVKGDWNADNYQPGKGYTGSQGAHRNAGTAIGTMRRDMGWTDCGHNSWRN